MKESQKDWITTELYKLYHDKMKERRKTRKLAPDYRDTVKSSLYEHIQNKEIWILYGEKKNAFSKTTKIVKSFKKQFPKLSEEIGTEHAKK
ncbi:hypothetical protein [Bacillus sp. UNC41MFS5]|uniref:hypothetical protein n=1 Tax=Bacillus sp. UNC41MFS5 TaxID=1449046 RepID=UPI0012DC387F|nr:hypothetical protein [Bacillus sp. UNC41MFS5]